jgi:hypothetical protein
MVNNVGINIILITENNFYDYETQNHPIHNAFQYLSATHKADYVRAYMLRHYGGAYSDIKQTNFNFNQYFDMLENSDKYCIGYPEVRPEHVGYEPARAKYSEYIGTGMSIHKKNTPLTQQWLYFVERVLDKNFVQLKKYPGTYHPRAIFGGILDNNYEFSGSKYPLQWIQLGPTPWHKAQFHNFGTWLFGLPFINIEDYR